MADRTADDRTTKARIRDAAIECFARNGVRETTARKVAEEAGVSPALVIHHFGSMDGLRAACDEHVVALIRQQKKGAAGAGLGFDVLGALREGSAPWLIGYLSAVIVEDSPAVEKLIDEMAADVEEYSQDFVEAGMLQPTGHPSERAALLLVWSLGTLVLRKHLKRLIGVDFDDPDMVETPEFARYSLATYEIYGKGILTPAAAEHLTAAFEAVARGDAAGDGEKEER